jgi:hypothetical protein
MRWAIAAAALVVLANGIVLISERRARREPATVTAVDVCSANLVGGGGSDDPPAIRLGISADSPSVARGLDSAGLRALGFSEASAVAAGRQRDSTFRWPTARPGWVRLRQNNDSLASFTIVEVAPRREQLAGDSTSLILRGLIAFRERRSEPAPGPAVSGAAHDHAAMTRGPTRGVLYPAVIEVIPALLHLDREQIAQLRAAIPDSAGCTVKQRAVIASGSAGGIWVQRLQ